MKREKCATMVPSFINKHGRTCLLFLANEVQRVSEELSTVQPPQHKRQKLAHSEFETGNAAMLYYRSNHIIKSKQTKHFKTNI